MYTTTKTGISNFIKNCKYYIIIKILNTNMAIEITIYIILVSDYRDVST